MRLRPPVSRWPVSLTLGVRWLLIFSRTIRLSSSSGENWAPQHRETITPGDGATRCLTAPGTPARRALSSSVIDLVDF